MTTKLERIFQLNPPFDKTHLDSKQNFGIGAARIFMGVKGEEGAYTFSFTIPLYCSHLIPKLAQAELDWYREHSHYGPLIFKLQGFGVDYHSRTKLHDYNTPIPNCQFLDGHTCYTDGSSLLAQSWCDRIMKEGIDWVYPELEKLYNELFKRG